MKKRINEPRFSQKNICIIKRNNIIFYIGKFGTETSAVLVMAGLDAGLYLGWTRFDSLTSRRAA